jgi:hypothetical protein
MLKTRVYWSTNLPNPHLQFYMFIFTSYSCFRHFYFRSFFLSTFFLSTFFHPFTKSHSLRMMIFNAHSKVLQTIKSYLLLIIFQKRKMANVTFILIRIQWIIIIILQIIFLVDCSNVFVRYRYLMNILWNMIFFHWNCSIISISDKIIFNKSKSANIEEQQDRLPID